MYHLLALNVLTANILGSFNDPFEFAGDYGEEVNPTRKYVFEQVISQEALTHYLSDEEVLVQMPDDALNVQEHRAQLIAQAAEKDRQHGPTLVELVPQVLIQQLIHKQQIMGKDFSEVDLHNFINFINRYGDQKIFYFLRHNPAVLLSMDQVLRKEVDKGGFDLPILSSTTPLKGTTALELKIQLLDSLFTQHTISLAASEKKLTDGIEKLDPDFLKEYLGPQALIEDLAIFATPIGQTFFYWLYQSLNLHLIAQDEMMIAKVNRVKQIFAETLGDSKVRAQTFRENLIKAKISVLFTQESDNIVPQILTDDGLFHVLGNQNSEDGTLVILRAEEWKANYSVIEVEDYEPSKQGRLNVILATKKTGEKFLLASCHGNSTRPEDGRLQITKVMQKYEQLSTLPENNHLQLVIGIDANTKSDEDVEDLRAHLDTLGLVGTSVGPTTIKMRMVTVQHPKAGRAAKDEEDFVIVLKPENGGRYEMTNPTVGFQSKSPDPSIVLPNVNNLSDHYPVGVSLHAM